MNLNSHNNPFLVGKMVKNGYYGNEDFGLPWDRIKVCQIGLFTTTNTNFQFHILRCADKKCALLAH